MFTPDDRAEVVSRIKKLQVRLSGSDGGHSVVEFLRGREAYLQNVPLSSNPHTLPNLRTSWEKGWIVERGECRSLGFDHSLDRVHDESVEAVREDLDRSPRSWRPIAVLLAAVVALFLRLTVLSGLPLLADLPLLVGITALLVLIALRVSR